MKFLAENLPIFNTSINKEIDETLKNYKGKYGNIGIIRVTVELEKTDIGGRLISEHSCLSGEDWRKRREKMQKQDDLDEVLSTRDKNDFASVFRALGIEDRIEYGTFNKLCELLLNKQCNVRERVRDMIVNNQSTLAVFDTSVRIRLKVLLIDEVDVCLSEKFCGGTYTPSVYLKDLSIKALLDSIREDGTLKTLNKVKTLSAYKNCATKYSN
ncbi:unnamed protein product [Didymodactylos carnosus]|uniref:Uncharacterized protein n=1 Tax=Didymodactylos carnosus TaxID=1234261 RepID=A0A8S2XY53_9BILA|nr:unnamed protein product [Didymodactylos carnosus]